VSEAEYLIVAGATVVEISIHYGDLARPMKLLDYYSSGRFSGHRNFTTADLHA
jgi:hypothetical protein